MITDRSDTFRWLTRVPFPNEANRQQEHDEITRLTDEFLARGGKIDVLPQMGSEREWPIIGTSFKPNTESYKQSAKRSVQARKIARSQSSVVGLLAAAEILGIRPKQLQRMCERNSGPYHTQSGFRGKRVFPVVDLEKFKREMVNQNG